MNRPHPFTYLVVTLFVGFSAYFVGLNRGSNDAFTHMKVAFYPQNAAPYRSEIVDRCAQSLIRIVDGSRGMACALYTYEGSR